MKKCAKTAIRAGLAMATLAAIFPLTTYAADVNVTATVNPSITLSVGGDIAVQGDAGDVLNGTISATVKANTRHTISVKTKTATTAMTSSTSGDEIPASTDVKANTNAWGIKAKTSATSDAGTYSAINATGVTLYTSTGNSTGTSPIDFTVGISTSPNITAGDYSIDLTVTAAAYAP